MAITADIERKFADFKTQYKHLYDKEDWTYIEKNFFDSLGKKEVPGILMQVYGALEINNSPAKFYRRHLRLIKNRFPLTGNIVEIGFGYVPGLGTMIAHEQLRLGAGTITLYDPLLVEEKPKYSNMTLRKEEFKSNTDISNYDLVIGIMACEATESILENAIKNHKDFYVAMCGCVHADYGFYPGYYMTPEDYQELVIDGAKKLIKEYNHGHLGITRLENTELNYPILYNKK
jgi:hypothetical protein